MADAQRKGLLERVLGLFADVRANEGPTALLLCLNIFIVLSTYYIVKPVREALILAGGGAEVKSYASAGQAVLLLLVVPLYAKLAESMPRKRLINIVTLFFAGCLVLFYMLARIDVPLGVVFFLWVGIFNLMVIAQFWSFANDVYTPEEGKRLFAIVAFGASAGAVFGSWITGRLLDPAFAYLPTFDVYELLLLSAALLGVSLLVTNLVDSRERHRARTVAAAKADEAEKPIGKGGAFQLVLQNRYLLLIAFLLLVLNWVNSTGEYLLGRTITNAAARAVADGTAGGLSAGEYIGRFYSDFFTVVNIVGLAVQLFLVSRILKYLGVRIAILFLPVIAFGGYVLLAFYPVLSVVRWAKTAENATDYSLQNTVRNALFLPTTREQKYKAKQAIDTFFVRAGDVLSAALVFAGTTWLGWSVTNFAIANLALVAAWLGLAVAIGRRYHRMTTSESHRE